MPGLVAQARRHRRKSLILPSVSARRSELLIKKCVARSGNAPKSEARREAAQTVGRAHERSEVTARGRDRRLRHARRRRRHVRGVTESLPSKRRTNVVSSRRGEAAVKTCPGIGVKPSFYLPHTNVVPSRRALRCSTKLYGSKRTIPCCPFLGPHTP